MNIKTIPALLVLLAVIAFPIFAHLSTIPIQLWDEGRFAVQALNIIRTNNWLVMQYNGGADMWMVKPPFMMWLQAISMKLAGYNELAIRLPSALAAVGTCLLLFFLFVKKIKDPLPGILSAVVLVTITGYTICHGERTGECDALLTMFTTAYSIFFFLYMDERQTKHLAATFFFLICAGLTKGIAAMMPLPGLLIYALYRKQVIHLLKQPTFYIGIVAFLLFVPGYYLLREHYNPGYIARVLDEEIFSRYTTSKEGHTSGSFFGYAGDLATQYFSYWSLWAVAGLVTGLLSTDRTIKQISAFSGIAAATFLLVLSSAHTQIFWYALPAYPFLSILIGIFIYAVYKALAESRVTSIMRYNVLPAAFLTLIFFPPYVAICNYVLSDVSGYTDQDHHDMQLYMQGVLHNNDKNGKGYFFLFDELDHDLVWYGMALEQEHRPYRMIHKQDLKGNELIAVFRPESKKYLADEFNCSLQYYYNNVMLYQLGGRKSADSTAVRAK